MSRSGSQKSQLPLTSLGNRASTSIARRSICIGIWPSSISDTRNRVKLGVDDEQSTDFAMKGIAGRRLTYRAADRKRAPTGWAQEKVGLSPGSQKKPPEPWRYTFLPITISKTAFAYLGYLAQTTNMGGSENGVAAFLLSRELERIRISGDYRTEVPLAKEEDEGEPGGAA